MSSEVQVSLTRLLLEYSDQTDHNLIMEMLASAQKGLTAGANDFADKASQAVQPGDLAGYLRCYPLAHALIGLIKFHELNKNTDVTRSILKLILDALDGEESKKTLH